MLSLFVPEGPYLFPPATMGLLPRRGVSMVIRSSTGRLVLWDRRESDDDDDEDAIKRGELLFSSSAES